MNIFFIFFIKILFNHILLPDSQLLFLLKILSLRRKIRLLSLRIRIKFLFSQLLKLLNQLQFALIFVKIRLFSLIYRNCIKHIFLWFLFRRKHSFTLLTRRFPRIPTFFTAGTTLFFRVFSYRLHRAHESLICLPLMSRMMTLFCLRAFIQLLLLLLLLLLYWLRS